MVLCNPERKNFIWRLRVLALCRSQRLWQKWTWHCWFCLMVSDVSSHWRNRKPRHPKAASQLYEFDTLQTSEGRRWRCKKLCQSSGLCTACLCQGAFLSPVIVLARVWGINVSPAHSASHLQRKSCQVKFQKYYRARQKKCTGTHFFEIADILEDERSFKSPGLQPYRC